MLVARVFPTLPLKGNVLHTSNIVKTKAKHGKLSSRTKRFRGSHTALNHHLRRDIKNITALVDLKSSCQITYLHVSNNMYKSNDSTKTNLPVGRGHNWMCATFVNN